MGHAARPRQPPEPGRDAALVRLRAVRARQHADAGRHHRRRGRGRVDPLLRRPGLARHRRQPHRAAPACAAQLPLPAVHPAAGEFRTRPRSGVAPDRATGVAQPAGLRHLGRARPGRVAPSSDPAVRLTRRGRRARRRWDAAGRRTPHDPPQARLDRAQYRPARARQRQLLLAHRRAGLVRHPRHGVRARDQPPRHLRQLQRRPDRGADRPLVRSGRGAAREGGAGHQVLFRADGVGLGRSGQAHRSLGRSQPEGASRPSTSARPARPA